MSHITYLNNTDDIKVEGIYRAFAEYFSNPEMYKIKDTGEYSMYLCKVEALLIVEFKYIITFVKKDPYPVGTHAKLLELKWVSLQTRILTDDHDISPYSYQPRLFPKLSNRISLEEKDGNGYTYSCMNLPLKVYLLPSKNGPEPRENGTLIQAIETYNTIITLIGA